MEKSLKKGGEDNPYLPREEFYKTVFCKETVFVFVTI